MAAKEYKIDWYDKEIIAASKDLVRKLNKASARRIKAGAKRMCPVWDGEGRKITRTDKSYKKRKPGALRDSIVMYPSKYDDTTYIVMAGSHDVFYASFVELGTKSWWAKGRDERYKVHEWMRRPIPEDPFLRNPLERERKLYNQRMREIFSK